jgi:hypothetical protein
MTRIPEKRNSRRKMRMKFTGFIMQSFDGGQVEYLPDYKAISYEKSR